MDRDINEVIRSLIARVQAGDFGIGFFLDVLAIAFAVLSWIDKDPPVFGDDGETLGLMIDLHEELTGEPVPAGGMLSGVLVSLVLRVLIWKALEVLAESDLPAAVFEILKKLLADILAKL